MTIDFTKPITTRDDRTKIEVSRYNTRYIEGIIWEDPV